jgi:TM2 domain-containing membrane protein YozV
VPPAAYAPAGEQLPTPVMASDEWYTSSGGQVYGPYPASDLRAWLQSGQMSWDTPASRGEGDPWRPLSAIAEFNPAPVYGVPVPGAVVVPGAKDKTIAGILAIVLGVLGAHHWYLGNYALAGIYLGITVLFGWTVIFHGGVENLLVIVSIVEGIIYLTASEDKFQRNYNRWFLNGP